MFHAKCLSSSSFGFLKENILRFFFWLPWQPNSAWNSILFKVDYQRNIRVKLDESGVAVYEEISFIIVKVYGWTDDGRTPDEKRSQKLTMSLCDR
jgi:hypothetical protein